MRVTGADRVEAAARRDGTVESPYYEDYGSDLQIRTLARTVTETDLVNFVALSGMYESPKRETRHADRGIVTTAHRIVNQRGEEVALCESHG
jgi:hypothetical protein